MRYLLTIIIIFTYKFSYSQYNPLPLSLSAETRVKLCDYQHFINKSKSEEEKILKEKLYLALLGVLSELSDYREQFLSDGKLINLFPTAYYHTTLAELKNIVDSVNGYDHPIEKMKQMLAFYDAYKFNRVTWDFGQYHLVEEHWKIHFDTASRNISHYIYADLKEALNTAIDAHVKYDLGRAIKFAFNNRYNLILRSDNLLDDFKRTDIIFSNTAKLTNRDIASTNVLYIEWVLNAGNSVLDKDEYVKDLRMESWVRAFNSINNSSDLLGVSGNPLRAQPTMNHEAYLSQANRVCISNPISSTLFLFDLSGSMNSFGNNSQKTKLQEAKDASKQTLASLGNHQSGVSNEVAVLGFSGGCSSDPTVLISSFETDLSLVEKRIDLMNAGGGTPLAEAIAAAECKLSAHLNQTGQAKGKMILLSDGIATCRPIRPNGVYNSGQLGQKIITVSANQCGNNNPQRPNISYYTIGFNIVPGSPAERDLQYLSKISGGKYLNVQNQVQLMRAFRKFNRLYIPKPRPALLQLPVASTSKFHQGLSYIKKEDFNKALKAYETFVQTHETDFHGVYNLALMQEANDLYLLAISNYQKYLQLCPNANDRQLVEKQMLILEEDFKQFALFQKEVVQSDLNYLKLHFDQIQNGHSIALAEEFKGFLREKGDYYDHLPELMGRNDRLFKKNASEVSHGLSSCKGVINTSSKSWDRDAVPLLSVIYLNLERLIDMI